MSLTYNERLSAGLVALGYRKEQYGSSKYDVFTKAGRNKYFVGPNGALRMGECVTRSQSMGCPTMCKTKRWDEVIAAGDKALGNEQPKIDLSAMSREDKLKLLAMLQS